MDSTDHHLYTSSVPQLRTFEWPPRGSFQYMYDWTLEKGLATFDARVAMQGCPLEPPPLSPKCEPARGQDPFGSPSSTRSGTPPDRSSETPLTAYSDDFEDEDDAAALHRGSVGRRDTHPPNRCFHCGLPWLDARQQSPSGESSHWFVDIHDGVSRKMAYLFCWRCVEAVQRRLQPSHLGCGHPFSPPPPPQTDGQLGRGGLMFCRGCRDSIGRGLGKGE